MPAVNRTLALAALFLLACQSPAPPPSAEPMPPTPAPSSSAPPPAATLAASVAAPTAQPTSPLPPAAGPGSLSITLRFPRIAEKPPVLSLIVYNRTPGPFHYLEHRSAPCQIASLISFTMRSAAGKTLPMAKCVPSPGVDRTVAAGANVELAIPLADLYPGLAHGTYDIAAFWLPEKPGGTAGPQREFSQPGHPLTIRPVMRSFVVKRGETVQLAAGATLTFAGHSHKDVDERSAPSPLIIEGTLTPAGGKPDKFYVNVQPEVGKPATHVFAVGDHYFELGEYEYGASMHLAYFGEVR